MVIVLYSQRDIFQSTSPVRGTTDGRSRSTEANFKFQSTSPVRGTTKEQGHKHLTDEISIHVPRAGDDPGRS